MRLPKGFVREKPSKGIDRPYYDIQGPTIHGPLRGILLSDHFVYGETHYVAEARRHLPCTRDKSCPWCGIRGKRRKAYIGAMSPRSRQLFVMEFTDCAITSLEAQTGNAQSLRGWFVTLTRKRNKKGDGNRQGKVEVEVTGPYLTDDLPPAFDETPHLEKMWGLLDDAEVAS